MANRNYAVCKACVQQRVSVKQNVAPDCLAAQVMSEMMMESKTGNIGGWSFCVCHLESGRGFDKNRMPPADCPYLTEHAVSREK